MSPKSPISTKTRGSRRLRRSALVRAAIILLAVATLVVLGAVAFQSVWVSSAAAVLAVGLGWVSMRLMWVEFAHGRLAHATERAEIARSYRALFAKRSVEQRMLTDRLSRRVAHTERRAATAEASLMRTRRELAAVRSELEAVGLQAAGSADVTGLMDWESRRGATTGDSDPQPERRGA